jgi:threonyl-tRNA synthetase
VGYKIRQQTLQKVPFMIIVGSKEAETGMVNLRSLNGSHMSFPNIEAAINHLVKSCRPPDVSNQWQEPEPQYAVNN